VFDHISKHLEVRQKYSAAGRIFNSLLGVWKCGQTRFFVFDILLITLNNHKIQLLHKEQQFGSRQPVATLPKIYVRGFLNCE